MKEFCDLRKDNGVCTKVRGNKKCKNCYSDESWFDYRFDICEIDEVCRKDSIFGNAYFKITKKQLEALKAGKVLYWVDEYGTFIILEQEDQDEGDDGAE